MKTEVLRPTPMNIQVTAQALKASQLVAVPTETVYGLAANAFDENAVKNIFKVKGRPNDNPLIVHISDVDEVYNYAKEIPQTAIKLFNKFSPGPLTIILKKNDIIPDVVTGGLSSVALRIPDSDIFRAVIKSAGIPIAAPSANKSGRPSPTDAQTVLQDMSGEIPYIIDGGKCRVGIESTVISLVDKPIILRPGVITKEQIEKIIGEVEIAANTNNEKALSPGMKYRHYAPYAKLTVINADALRGNKYILDNINEFESVICYEGEQNLFESKTKSLVIGDENSPDELSKNLYSVLRDIDKQGIKNAVLRIDKIDDEYYALFNRISKACGYNIVEI